MDFPRLLIDVDWNANPELLDTSNISIYLQNSQQNLFTEILGGGVSATSDVGDGNINQVLKVTGVNGNKLCIKQARGNIRIVPEQKLSSQRILFEWVYFNIQSNIDASRVPKLYAFDPRYMCMITEFIDEDKYQIMRKYLSNGNSFSGSVIGKYLAESLFATSVFKLDIMIRRKLEHFFNRNDEMDLLTEEAVFSSPLLQNGRFRNRTVQGHLQTAIRKYQRDPQLQCRIGYWKRIFITKKEVLCHGDLHTGSIFVDSNGDIKVFDAEFASFHAPGFDIGMLIANLVLSAYAQQDTNPLKIVQDLWKNFCDTYRNLLVHQRDSYVAPECADATRADFLGTMEGTSNISTVAEQYLKELFNDMIGFAGCEIFRRIVGIATVSDFDHVSNRTDREVQVLGLGVHMILHTFTSFESWIDYVLKELKKPPYVALHLVARLPRVGKCKTRLANKIGADAAHAFVVACLRGLLRKIDSLSLKMKETKRFSIASSIVFWPSNDREDYAQFLKDHDLDFQGQLMPVHCMDDGKGNLGDGLSEAIENDSEYDAIVFIGMDTPHLKTKEITKAIDIVLEDKNRKTAFLSPALDGGYVLLAVPYGMSYFKEVEWSSSNTMKTQISSLSQAGIDRIHLGQTYADIDTWEDLHELWTDRHQLEIPDQVNNFFDQYSSLLFKS